MPKTTPQFDQAYQKLNLAQKQAVDSIEGPTLVLAGPGTGKTQVLTVRIANILRQTDTDPSSILALTFTDAAAREMKERLISLIGKDGYHVKICTYHALCNEIISDNPERFSRPAGLQTATDLEKIQIIKDILEQNSYTLLKPIGDPLLYLPYIKSALSDLKREGVTPKKFSELVSIIKDEFELERGDLKKTALLEKEKLVNKNLDLLDVYEKYQQKLKDQGRYDYDDMINWVVEAFETDPDFLLSYEENFQYILADEYQDTNSAQNRLLFAFSEHWGEGANIFAVGDENQSIYGFQGASRHNIIQFRQHFPSLTQVTLTDNYRSTPTILKSSAALLGEPPLTPTVKLKDQDIRVVKFSSPILEDEFIADTIQKKIKQGTPPKDIAVIVRENKDIENLVNIFKHKKLPFRLQGGTNVLHTPLVSQFLKLLTVVSSLQGPVDDLDLFTVLNFPYLNLNPLSILQASRLAYQNRTTLVDTLLHDNPELDDQLVDVFHQFNSWSYKSSSLTLTEIFQIILQKSGLLEHILALPQPLIELNRFGTLFEDVKSQAAAYPGLTLQGYVFNLHLMDEHNIRLEEQSLLDDQNAVTLTTAHKAKGLEWRTVFVYRFADSYWGNKSVRQMIKLPPGIINLIDNKEYKNAEERRLFYVAITRAKQQLYLTGATQYPSSAKMIFPSMFLEDIPLDYLKRLKTKQYEKKAEKILAAQLTTSPLPTLVDGEAEYLLQLIKDFKLSPTSLNTFLECPYKFKLDHLYKIPRAKAAPMCFGTAVHFALEHLYQGLNNGKLESKDDFIQDFEISLRREILSDSDFKDRLEHGRKILSQYYDHYEKEFAPCLFTEKKFGDSLSSQIFLDDIPLSGKADRIDPIDAVIPARALPEAGIYTDHSNKKVRFIDYKTGKVRTRGEIEGTTQNSDGDYKRQLTFYHLLAELDKSFHYKIAETELDFIEPKDGVFKKERFNIQKEEVDNLKEVIRTSMKEIRALHLDRTKDTTPCDRCDFKFHCWPEGIASTKVSDQE